MPVPDVGVPPGQLPVVELPDVRLPRVEVPLLEVPLSQVVQGAPDVNVQLPPLGVPGPTQRADN